MARGNGKLRGRNKSKDRKREKRKDKGKEKEKGRNRESVKDHQSIHLSILKPPPNNTHPTVILTLLTLRETQLKIPVSITTRSMLDSVKKRGMGRIHQRGSMSSRRKRTNLRRSMTLRARRSTTGKISKFHLIRRKVGSRMQLPGPQMTRRKAHL